MPPVTLISHLADLEHARVLDAAERHHHLFRRRSAAVTRSTGRVISLPTVDAVDTVERPARVA